MSKTRPVAQHQGGLRPLGMTLRSLYRFIDEGELDAYRFGRVIRLKEATSTASSSPAASRPGPSSTSIPPRKGADTWTTACSAGSSSATVPADVVAETDRTLAFRDLNPMAPTHVLVIPRRHITNAGTVVPEDAEILVATCWSRPARWPTPRASAGRTAATGWSSTWAPTAFNSVPHLHLHVIGGRP